MIPPKQKATEVEYPKLSQPLRDRRESVFDLEVDKIRDNPYQPRYEMEAGALKDLAASIKQHGILQPIIVTKNYKETHRGQGVEYQLVAGHRRLAAAKLAGLPTVPAIVRDSTEQQKLELALVENLQRADLNALERAKAFRALQEEFDLTHEEIGRKVGKSREYVSNTLRLVNLPEVIQQGLRQGIITEGHARTIAGVKNSAAQVALFEESLKNNLSVREMEQRAREVCVQAHKRQVMFDPELRHIARRLELHLGRPVKIRKNSLGGRVMVFFDSKAELEGLTRKILSNNQ